MGKYLILLLLLFLNACTTAPSKIQTEDVNMAVLYVPKPPSIPPLQLEYFKLTDSQLMNDGEVAKAVQIDYIVLTYYIKIYMKVIDKYIELSEKNPDFEKLSNDSKKTLEKIQNDFDEITKNIKK